MFSFCKTISRCNKYFHFVWIYIACWVIYILNITCQNLYHMPINPKTIYHPKGHRPEGRYRFWHLMFIISYISTMPLIIHVFYQYFEFFWKFRIKKFYLKYRKILKFRNFFGIRYRLGTIIDNAYTKHLYFNLSIWYYTNTAFLST